MLCADGIMSANILSYCFAFSKICYTQYWLLSYSSFSVMLHLQMFQHKIVMSCSLQTYRVTINVVIKTWLLSNSLALGLTHDVWLSAKMKVNFFSFVYKCAYNNISQVYHCSVVASTIHVVCILHWLQKCKALNWLYRCWHLLWL